MYMEIETITASYSRKVNHQLYGGGAFENSDSFVSMSASVSESDDIKAITEELQAGCKELVESAIDGEISSFHGTSKLPPEQFHKFLYDYVAGRCKDVELFKDTLSKLAPAHYRIIDTIRRARATKKRDELKEEAVIE